MINVARHSKAINAIFSSLSSEERQQLESILSRISVKVQKYNKD
jgi:hypothetical protein